MKPAGNLAPRNELLDSYRNAQGILLSISRNSLERVGHLSVDICGSTMRVDSSKPLICQHRQLKGLFPLIHQIIHCALLINKYSIAHLWSGVKNNLNRFLRMIVKDEIRIVVVVSTGPNA